MEHATFTVTPNTHTETHKHICTETKASHGRPFTFSPRLHVYHLAVVQLEYRADVSVSPADVDGDVQEWQEPESRMRLRRLRVDLQPWLSVECGVLPQKTSASFPDEYSYNQGVKAQRVSGSLLILDKE